MTQPIEDTVRAAVQGDRHALEALVKRVQDDVYQLARRMLWNPADAEDATQEILVRIVTNLGSFRAECAFSTWVFRVACNHLLNTRKSAMERRALTLEQFGEAVEDSILDPAADQPLEPERVALAKEVMVACTSGMLLCLDRDHRVAYILGEIVGFEGDEAAAILEVSPGAFRKRLSRARARIRDFMEAHCGLVNEDARCRCERQIGPATAKGRIDATALPLTSGPERHPEHPSLVESIREMGELHRSVRVFRGHPDHAAPQSILAHFRALLDSGRFRILSN
ncbi:MAG: RNA polymerase sigma factor [Polyangiaceae bacterium]|nr:RNA polymerase sigma factor [Polyangiaceae bacterium]